MTSALGISMADTQPTEESAVIAIGAVRIILRSVVYLKILLVSE